MNSENKFPGLSDFFAATRKKNKQVCSTDVTRLGATAVCQLPQPDPIQRNQANLNEAKIELRQILRHSPNHAKNRRLGFVIERPSVQIRRVAPYDPSSSDSFRYPSWCRVYFVIPLVCRIQSAVGEATMIKVRHSSGLCAPVCQARPLSPRVADSHWLTNDRSFEPGYTSS